jgi:hypothetical protein
MEMAVYHRGCRDCRLWSYLRDVHGEGSYPVLERCILTIQPEYPYNAKILNPTEKAYAVWRLEMEAGASEANDSDISNIRAYASALKDPKVHPSFTLLDIAYIPGLHPHLLYDHVSGDGFRGQLLPDNHQVSPVQQHHHACLDRAALHPGLLHLPRIVVVL